MARLAAITVSLLACVAACGGASPTETSDGGGGAGGAGGARTDGGGGAGGMHADAGDAGDAGGTGGGGGTGGTGGGGGLPAGWLYTSGNKVHVSNGNGGGAVWVGRGVNVDDIFFCGYNSSLWMPSPDQTLETMISGLMSGWKPTFVRISLSMATDSVTTSWLTNAAQYQTPMTAVINDIGSHAGVYVLVTLRSDASMIGQDTVDGDPEATGLPSDSTTTPDHTKFPTGTDATYVALVDSFAHAPFVLFGLSNEPGGNKLSSATIAAAMTHAVGVIRAEEDRLGVPHHIVAVQGNVWTSDLSVYAATPVAHDNVVYEIHGYPPVPAEYTYANLPVIIGEHGSLDSTTAPAFFADVESKQISTLAWDFDPFSDCAPDLLAITRDATMLAASSWGSIVQAYLLSHAP